MVQGGFFWGSLDYVFPPLLSTIAVELPHHYPTELTALEPLERVLEVLYTVDNTVASRPTV